MLIVMHKVNHNMYTPPERFLGILQDALVPKLLCSMYMLLPFFVIVYVLFEIWWGMLTWTICELLEGRKAVESKWVHKVKCKSDGSIEGSDCYQRIWDWLWANVFMSCQVWLHQDNLLMTALSILQNLPGRYGLHQDNLVHSCYINSQKPMWKIRSCCSLMWRWHFCTGTWRRRFT